MKSVDEILKKLVELKGSDLYLIPGNCPTIRIDDKMLSVEGCSKLTSDETNTMIKHILSPKQLESFENTKECNIAYSVPKMGRFRVNIFVQRSTPAIVFRRVSTEIPTVEELGLPSVLKDFSEEKRGLILVTGATGTGKSTTLAAMLGHRNSTKEGHIITIEDPLEFLHASKKSIVSQREVVIDTVSYREALKNALRQTPDVILIGEMRDLESVEMAINFAETGHLVMSTLHSTNAYQSLQRIMQFFPSEAHKGVQYQLSLNLKAIISQRLIQKQDKSGRVVACEIMVVSQRIKDLIAEGDFGGIKDVMVTTDYQGMQTFDEHIYRLWKEKVISEDEAIINSDNPNDLKLRIKGVSTASIRVDR